MWLEVVHLLKWKGPLFVSIAESTGVMPLYTAISQEGTISTETKAKIAQEITRARGTDSRAIVWSVTW
jgi:hypothetical protein